MNTSALDPAPVPKKLTVAGLTADGIFDPSIAKDPISGKLWMSYSAVNKSALFPTQNNISPHTRLAFSTDAGDSWTDIGAVNAISDVTLPLAAPNHAGTWMNEVSTLIYDPGANSGERWKLMWQTFLKINGVPHFEHSWIAVKMAATPEALAMAPAVKLFASFLYDTGNNSAASATAPPIATTPAIQIDTAFAQLKTCIMGEPSLYANSSAVYLTLQCEQFNDPANNNDNDRLIFLMKCTSPCNLTNAASWTVLGRLFNRSESTAVEPFYNGGYAAPALVSKADGVYLLVTPTEDPDTLYKGCTAFKFADLDRAQLEKSGGFPVIKQKIEGSIGKFRGACSYHGDETAGGVLQSELSALPNGEFQIFSTHIKF